MRASEARVAEELAAFAGREVLIVDDDEDFRTIISNRLLKAGLVVDIVESASRGLEHCAGRTPSLILMDVWMPGLSGIQACPIFRDQRATADVPIILMSAQWRDEAHLMRALDAGATDVLAKERAGVELMARVRSALMLSSVQIRLRGSEEKLEELRHFISICAGCKQVRNDRGEWEGIETYLRHVTERELTHGICPTCRERLYGSIGR
jgi:DNA-binding response OmpR family regulator